MIPIRLKLKGFLSYLDPVEIDFSHFNLACISGANGAGKSSLLDAMTWALFGQARKTDDSLINTHAEDKTAEVVYEFSYENNIYRIQRSKIRDKPVRLEFFILFKHDPNADPSVDVESPVWKPLTGTSIRETQANIEKTLHMEYETFINASFFLQGKADLFAQQRPGERKRILSSILGLDIWEKYRDQAAAKRKETEDEVASIDGQLREINTELNEGPARRARLAELEKDLDRLAATRKTQADSVESLRKLVQALAEQRKHVETLERTLANELVKRDRLLELVASRKKEHQEYQDKLGRAAEIESAYQNWLACRQALEQWEVVAAQFRQHQEKRQAPLLAIEAERGRLLHEQEAMISQQKTIEAAIAETLGLKVTSESAQQAIIES